MYRFEWYQRLWERRFEILSEARRMGEEGRKRMIRMFSWDVMAERTVEIYERVLQSKG